MTKRKQYPSQARLRELFDYDPEGFLIWKVGQHKGKMAGHMSVNSELRYSYDIRYRGVLYSGSVMIYIYHHGKRPRYVVHADFNQANNRIENLVGMDSRKGFSAGHWKSEREYRFVCEDKSSGTWYNTVGLQRHFYSPAAAAQFADSEIERLGLIKNKNGVKGVDLEKYRASGKYQIKNYRPDGTSKFIGVSRHKELWTARCAHEYIGLYDTEEDAARAYNVAAIKRYGDSAEINDIKNPFSAPIKKRRETSSGYTGVYARGRRFYSRFNRRNLGTFNTKEEAARAYNRAARDHYGELAVLNDVPDPFGDGDVF